MLKRNRFGMMGVAASLAVALGSSGVRAEGVRKGPVPSWVSPASYEACRFSREALSGGTCRLLMEVQRRVDKRTQAEYRHSAVQILDATGVEAESEIEFDYDPAFETVTLHYIHLIRDGKTFERLNLDNVTEFRREESLEMRMLDGASTLHIIVEDVRPGDVIESAFTVEGRNPALDGQFYTVEPTAWPQPIQRLRIRIVTPESFYMQAKSVRTKLTPKSRSLPGGLHEYLVEGEMVPSVLPEPNTPLWYDPLPHVQFSSSRSWSEAASWGAGLYVLSDAPSARVKKEIDRIAAEATTPEERAVSALRFVQDEIRYLGIEIGEGSYVPRNPALVLERRFGDCKDKTFLLLNLFLGLGIEAYPALVNLDLLDHVDEQLPSAAVFNHVIVAARIGGKLVFMDPTARSVPGTLKDLVQPDYGKALVLRKGENGLTLLPPRRPASPLKIVEESFDLSLGPKAPATLTVRSTFRDEDADYINEQLTRLSRAELAEELIRSYRLDYPKIETAAPITVHKDTTANRVVLEERYTIPRFWSEDEGRPSARLFPREIHDLIALPPTGSRTAPLAVAFPMYTQQITTVRVPVGASLPENSVRAGDEAFRFESEVRRASQGSYRISYTFETLADHVSPKKSIAHQRKRNQVAAHIGNTLRQTAVSQIFPPISWERLLPWYLFFVLLFFTFLLSVVRLAIRVFRFDPAPFGANTEGARLGGWLLLLGVLLFVPPVSGVFGGYRAGVWLMPISLEGMTRELFADGNGIRLASIVFYEMVKAADVIFAGVIMMLFVRRRSSFPVVFVSVTAIRFLLLMVSDAAIAHAVDPEAFRLSVYSRLGSAAYTVWGCAYVGLSRRVKRTFRVQRKEKE